MSRLGNDDPASGQERTRAPRPSRRVERAALAMSALWIAATVGALVLFGGAGLTSFAIVMLSNAIVLPLAVIWLFVFARRLTATLLQDNARLRALLGEVRRDLAAVRDIDISEAPNVASPIREHGVDLRAIDARLSELADGQRRTEMAVGRLATDAAPRTAEQALRTTPAPPAPEPALRDVAPARLELADLIAALQFPADPDDVEGFDALRRALRDRGAAQLVTSAQDVLTLLSQDGIYMDDLDPPAASPDLWRLFAAGERSGPAAVFEDIATSELVDRVRGRIREDTIFRDAVHHFLRLFDQRFSELADDMTDAEIAALIRTRSARAFFMLGQTTEMLESE